MSSEQAQEAAESAAAAETAVAEAIETAVAAATAPEQQQPQPAVAPPTPNTSTVNKRKQLRRIKGDKITSEGEVLDRLTCRAMEKSVHDVHELLRATTIIAVDPDTGTVPNYDTKLEPYVGFLIKRKQRRCGKLTGFNPVTNEPIFENNNSRPAVVVCERHIYARNPQALQACFPYGMYETYLNNNITNSNNAYGQEYNVETFIHYYNETGDNEQEDGFELPSSMFPCSRNKKKKVSSRRPTSTTADDAKEKKDGDGGDGNNDNEDGNDDDDDDDEQQQQQRTKRNSISSVMKKKTSSTATTDNDAIAAANNNAANAATAANMKNPSNPNQIPHQRRNKGDKVMSEAQVLDRLTRRGMERAVIDIREMIQATTISDDVPKVEVQQWTKSIEPYMGFLITHHKKTNRSNGNIPSKAPLVTEHHIYCRDANIAQSTLFHPNDFANFSTDENTLLHYFDEDEPYELPLSLFPANRMTAYCRKSILPDVQSQAQQARRQYLQQQAEQQQLQNQKPPPQQQRKRKAKATTTKKKRGDNKSSKDATTALEEAAAVAETEEEAAAAAAAGGGSKAVLDRMTRNAVERTIVDAQKLLHRTMGGEHKHNNYITTIEPFVGFKIIRKQKPTSFNTTIEERHIYVRNEQAAAVCFPNDYDEFQNDDSTHLHYYNPEDKVFKLPESLFPEQSNTDAAATAGAAASNKRKKASSSSARKGTNKKTKKQDIDQLAEEDNIDIHALAAAAAAAADTNEDDVGGGVGDGGQQDAFQEI